MPTRYSNAPIATVFGVVLGVAGLLSIAIWTEVLWTIVGGTDRESAAFYVVSTLAVGPGTGTIAALYLIGADRGIDYLDLPRPTRRHAAYAVVAAAALLALNVAADSILNLFAVESATHDIVATARSDPSALPLLIPLAYLSVGLGEELLFRNVIQKSLYDAVSRRSAIVVASLVFAAVHFSAFAVRSDPLPAVLVSLALVFALSLVLGVAYERTGSLLVPAFAHGTFDAAVYAILYVEVVGLPG